MRKIEPASRLKRTELDKIPPKDRKKSADKKKGTKVEKVKKHLAQSKYCNEKRKQKNLNIKVNKNKK